MADQEGQETNVDEGDGNAAIREAREAAKRSAQAKKDAEDRASAAESELARIKAESRIAGVKALLGKLGAPAGLADFYPADLELTEEAVKGFVTERIGFSPEQQEAWQRYEQTSGATHPPGSGPDPLEKLRAEALRDTANVYAKKTVVTDAEREAYTKLKTEVERLDREYGAEVSAGRRPPLVDVSRGFGGLYDPPSYAIRTKSGRGAQD